MYLTIRPVALSGYGSIAPEAKPNGLFFASWAVDPWPLRAKGLIVLVSPNKLDRKGSNKVSKCKLKKYLFGGKNERKTNEFRYSMTITIRPLVV